MCFLVSLELAGVFFPMLHSTQSEYSRLCSPLSLILELVILLGVLGILGAGEGSNLVMGLVILLDLLFPDPDEPVVDFFSGSVI